MAKQDEYVRYTIRVPRPVYERMAALPGEGSINARIVNAIDAAASGKTLRDGFAMAALTGLCANHQTDEWTFDTIAANAYRAANSMILMRSVTLDERQKGGA
jgi:hypothetical protein